MTGRKAAFVYSDVLSRHTLSPEHPLKPVRLRYTYELLDSYGAFEASNVAVMEPLLTCPACGKLYWRGTHWRNTRLEGFSGRAPSPSRLMKNGVCRGAEPLCRVSEGVPQI